MKRRAALTRFATACAALAAAFCLPQASAQSGLPAHPITIVVPKAPGGAIDILARLLEQRLRKAWGQPVIVVYKPGAGTVVGASSR